jgi:hypothetical protein
MVAGDVEEEVVGEVVADSKTSQISRSGQQSS